MGTKPVFKRYKNPVYFTFCIAIGLFLSSCQHLSLMRILPASVDTNEKKYLTATSKLVLNKDFKSAARENQRMLKYYSRTPDMNDIILSNYIENRRIISDLLTRILDDEKRAQTLYGKFQLDMKQIKALTLKAESLKKSAAALIKQLAGMDALVEKIKTIENENRLLQKQIEQLKQIDLKPNKISGNLGSS